MVSQNSRIMFIQYGDFREASINLHAGNPESYYAQHYSVRFVEELCEQVKAIGVISLNLSNNEEYVLSSGVITSGMEYYKNPRKNLSLLLAKITDFSPTHLVVRTPLLPVMAWAVKNNICLLPIFADSFNNPNKNILVSIKHKVASWRLAKILNNESVGIVANHNLPACRSLKKIGVVSKKIIPWDWPSLAPDKLYSSKKLTPRNKYSLFYAGAISVDKGVEDLIVSISILKKKGVEVSLTLAGSGEIDSMKYLAQKKGINKDISFLGIIDNNKIIKLMNQHDIVVVPSRYRYPEGFPMTIYEAMASGSPLIASDHPMLREKLFHRINSLIFRAGRPESLAENIGILLNDVNLYNFLSSKSHESYQKLFVPTLWADLVSRWLTGSSDDVKWLRQRNFDSYYRFSH